MNIKLLLFSTITAAVCVAVCASCDRGRAPKEFTTEIRGTVIDRPDSKALLLSRSYEDTRVAGIEIPIVEGRFEYDLTTDTREMWQLIFMDEMQRGSMIPTYFFSEPGTVELILHPFDLALEENKVRGGKLNTEYAAFRDSILMWENIKRKEGGKIIERGYKPRSMTMSWDPETQTSTKTLREPDTSTPEGLALHREWLALEKRTLPGKMLEYFRSTPSMVSYAWLYRSIKSELQLDEEAARPYIDIYNEVGYAEKFPDSPYTRELANLLGAVGNIKVGGRYIDFTLPDLDGNSVTVSEYIAGKVALIDLWMTWCGPCRSSAMDAIPVYEEFRDRGFTVIGVNGDSDLEGIKAAAAKDGYPWPTLVDLKGAAGIWSKYGIGGAGGSSYLVDRDGTILAVNPRADQLRSILSEKLAL
jgi:peroxiredoxin